MKRKRFRQLPPREEAVPKAIIGVGWYTEEEWTKVKATALDPDRFERTYAEWVQMAEKGMEKLRAVGLNVEKAYVEAADLLEWCRIHKKRNDSASRAQFVLSGGRRSEKKP